MIVNIINRTHNANIYGVFEDDNPLKPAGTVQVILSGRDCGIKAYTNTAKYTAKQILNFYRIEKKTEKLFNQMIEHYGTESDTMHAVKIALDNNLTPAQVYKIY